MKREVNPQICSTEAYTLAHYEQTFREREGADRGFCSQLLE